MDKTLRYKGMAKLRAMCAMIDIDVETMLRAAGLPMSFLTDEGRGFSAQQTFAAWRLVFLLTVVINGVCGLQYIFFCKAEIQWWNTYWKSESESKEVQKA